MALDSTIFYVMDKLISLADIDSATSEATGFIKAHLLDGALGTAWKPTSTGDQEIVIDLNQSFSSDYYAFGFFIKNYLTDHSAGTFKVYHSTNGSTWGTAIISQSIGSDLEPVRIFDVASAGVLNRYLKITFTGMATTIEVSHLFICRKATLSQGPQFPIKTGYKFVTDLVGEVGAYRAHARYRNSLLSETRTYNFISSTNFNILKGVFDDAGGDRSLIVIRDSLGGVLQDGVVVRIDNDFQYSIVDYDLYDVSINIQQVHYPDPNFGY